MTNHILNAFLKVYEHTLKLSTDERMQVFRAVDLLRGKDEVIAHAFVPPVDVLTPHIGPTPKHIEVGNPWECVSCGRKMCTACGVCHNLQDACLHGKPKSKVECF